MGKRGRKNFGGKGGNFAKKSRQARDGVADAAAGGWDDAKQAGDGFSEWVYTNDNFIRYYKAQGVVPEDEWDTFMKFLGTPLPTTFRINNSCPFAERIRERIATDFKFDGLVLDGEEVAPIACMPWYPDEKGFQWSVERRKVRKLPLLAEFQKWLVELTTSGSTTRQEAVSMIPPLILGVEPHHKVLDMCAAPGSKTSQLLESLHAHEFVTGATPTGVVVANDVDLKRAYMLVHQSKRIGSPALVVTCHEAQHLPFVGDPARRADGFFDRILCDAPCSGDGTLRKNPVIWKQWDAKNGLALHPLQVEIAKRGAALLTVGGLMCYSTCTFNPLENEAVVAELLRWAGGALELVDVADRLPRLKRRAGLSTWKVLGSGHVEYASVEHAAAEGAASRGKNKITRTMFPPTTAEAAAFQLARCMRCVPHDENTGGFFICLLKKTAPTPELPEDDDAERQKRGGKKQQQRHASKEPSDNNAVKSEGDDVAAAPTGAATEKGDDAPAGKDDTSAAVKEETDDTEATAASAAPDQQPEQQRAPRLNRQERKQLKQKGEEYVGLEPAQWERIQAHFGIAAPFSGAQLFTRSDEVKSVTFVTASITRELVEAMKAKKLKIVYTGLKLFERTESAASGVIYRLCQAGVPHVLPFMTQRKIRVSLRDFQLLLERLGDLLDYDEFEPATQRIFEDAPMGSIVCMMEQPRSLVEEKIMNVVVWRGRNSVNVMATKADAVVILSAMKELKLFDEGVSAAVQLAKQQRDAERSLRDQPTAVAVVAAAEPSAE
ncbi:hypothetical protein PybrP1_003321 [[Pythium] brassicae (nom. inval.)]|nr:hypothetical protein PybrP1_003321 [[Pythium] brassicae (nom. inval.)]